MSTFGEYTRKKKKKEENISFREYTKNVLGDDFNDDIAPVGTYKASVSDFATLDMDKTEKKEFVTMDKTKASEKFATVGNHPVAQEEKEKWYEGWLEFDKDKNVLGSVADVVEDAFTGIIGMGEKVVDALAFSAPYALKANTPYVPNQELIEQQEKIFIDAKEEAQEFIEKDLYDEKEVAKKIISSILGAAYQVGVSQNGGFMTDADYQIVNQYQEDAMNYLNEDMERESVFGDKSDSLVQSGGQLLATAGLQAVGVPWWVTTGATSFGGEVENALNQGASFEEAGMSAAISAGAEILTEKISGGISFGGKTLDDVFTNGLSRTISNKVVRNLTKIGIDVAGEGAEEVLSSVMSRLGSALYKEENIEELLASEEALDEYIESFIGGGVLGGVSSVSNAVKSDVQGVDFVSGLTESEKAVVDKVYKDAVEEQETDGNKLTNKKKSEIYDATLLNLEKGYIDTDTIESVLGGESYNTYKSITEQEKALREEYNTLNTMKTGDMTGEQLDRRVELKRQLEDFDTTSNKTELRKTLDSEMFGIVQGTKLSESYNERYRRGQVFEVDLDKYDAKQREVVKKAVDSGILNNTNRTHDFVDMVAKISADKGVLFDFTNNQRLKESGFAVDGKIVNGFVTNGNVTLNIDSAKSLNSVVGHEITHVLEGTDIYAELQNMVKQYATTKGEYDTRYQAMQKLYEGMDADIDAEITADLVGDYLFTDSNFINKLSVEKPSLFNRIFSEIKFMYRMATAGSKEQRELEKVKRTFEKAYRDSAKKVEYDAESDTGTQYSVSVTDQDTVDFLENQEHITTYKAMQLIDGKLYPPMAAKVKGENGRYQLTNPSQLGVWQQATEDAKNIKKFKNGVGYYTLNKGDGTSVDAAYNPYEHSSNLVLNDQFESAYRRDNLVTVEGIIPVSEMTSGYKAEYAKDSTGVMDWKSGVVAGKLSDNKRQVYLSRYFKPVRIMEDSEVASKYKEILDGQGVKVPFNVVSPSLLSELEKAGVDIDYDGSPNYQYHAKKKGTQYSLSESDGGYNGRSMSNRAVRAYQNREAPLSKWTKAVLVESIQEYMTENDIESGETDLNKLTVAELRENFLEKSSWHHTGAMYNKTDFYKLKEDTISSISKDMVDEIILNRNPVRELTASEKQAIADNKSALESAKGVYDKLDIIYQSGVTGLKTLDGVYRRWKNGSLDIDEMYSRVVDKVIADDSQKVNLWSRLPEGHYRHNSVDMFNNDIDAYIKDKYNNTGSRKRGILQGIKGTFVESNIKYSLSDSEGKQLTEGQQEYFRDSKMRDENGNLKVMYHGSEKAGFHEFSTRMSDDGTSFFFTDDSEVAKSYSGVHEIYSAKTLDNVTDLNNFFKEIDQTEYEAVEENGEFVLLEDGDEVARSSSAKGLYDEFCDWTGLGYGSTNYKVYLNLKNPLIVDANDNNWNEISREFSQEFYDKLQTLTAEEKEELNSLTEWDDISIFRDELSESYDDVRHGSRDEHRHILSNIYEKLGKEDVDMYRLFDISADNFTEESMRKNAVRELNTRDYAQRAKEQGYDGVIFNNIVDNGLYASGIHRFTSSTVAVAFDSNQIKSVDNVNPTSDGDIRYSLSSIANTFFGDENMSADEFMKVDYKQTDGYKKYVEQCINNFSQSRANYNEEGARTEIEDSIDGIVRVAIAAKNAGYDIYDDSSKRVAKDSKKRLLFSSLEPNSDYFTSNDISTICDKRKNFAEIYDDIVRAEESKNVQKGKRFFDNVDNYFYLHNIMAEKGLTQPCRQCYVESMRKNLAPMANAFLKLVGETNPNNTMNDQLYHPRGKNKGSLKTNNAALRERVIDALSEYGMSASDLNAEALTTENGLAQLKIQAPLVYEAFNSFYGQSKPKMPKAATPFRFGELTALLTDEKGKIKKTLVDKINSTGGFRLQSYSDFQIQNYTDTLQVIFEAGTLGLNGHAYTKVPAFLEATDGTNLKRNISIFMYKDGSEWKLDRNDSFPYMLEEIYRIVSSDESGNTGIIAVSQNEDMSAWIMANDMVGYGIPFHKSGLKMNTVRNTTVKEGNRDIQGYTGTKDHTRQQTEVWAKTTSEHKANTKVSKGINIYRFWDFDNKNNLSKNELIEKNVKAYIDACEDAGYLPKFREYVMNNDKVLDNVLKYSKEMGYSERTATIDDISFEYKGYKIPYGYYKFLGDFGMFKPDGTASPHEMLSLSNYDFDKAVKFFEDSEGLRRNEILQQFANGDEREHYRNSGMTAGELAEIVKQKRGEVVDSVVNGNKYSLSEEGEAPVKRGSYHVYGRDMKYVNPYTESVAPVADDVAQFSDSYAPLTEEESILRDYINERDNYYLDDVMPMSEEEATDGEFAVHMKPADPFYERDIRDVGNRSVKAYMYENPEVKPFFQAEANIMLGELNSSTKGERFYNDQLYYDTSGEMGFFGTQRQTSDEIAYLLDEFNYTYKDIEKGLKAIIEDNGKENNAISKRIEFLLDERLRLGYKDFTFGLSIPKNQDYINVLEAKEITEYNDEAWNNWLRGLSEEDLQNYFYARENNIAPTEEYIPVNAETSTQNTVEEAPLYDAVPGRGVIEGQQSMFKEEEHRDITRSGLHESIIDNIRSEYESNGYRFEEVLNSAKNLSTFATVDNTPQRVMEKALGYKEGQILADLTVNKVAQNETEAIRWLNLFTDRKKGLLAQISKQYNIKPGSKKSAAAQMYAEGFYVNDADEIIKYGDEELAKDFPDLRVQENIKGLARDARIRQIYDETLDAINASRTRNAYPAIQKLDNYFLHFRAMDDTFSRIGMPFNPNDIRAKDLPTDLNGVTADLKPGQPYFASAMHRQGKRTSFDLLGGLERYLTSAKNQIYHIDDIQTLRALRNYIADTYGQAHGLEKLDELTDAEAQERISEVYGSHLSTFAKFLNEEANILAGKTALIDRGLEGVIGRRGITFLDTVNRQVGSNMVGFTISSSLTNFLPVAQTFAKSNKYDFVKAFAQTASNKIGSVFGKTDGFAEQSPVIIRRKGSDRFYRTPFQKVGDAGYVVMSAVDDISTELIARTKYNELTRKGMNSQQAHFETDKWVSRLMGDRSLGQQPQLYNSKMLGLITKFQLEVRNQLDSQFYDTIQEAKVSSEDIQNGLARNAVTAAKVASTFVQLAVAQHLFGKAFESVAGYNPAFDIIDVLLKTIGYDDDEDSEDTVLDNVEQGFLELLEDLPYTSTLTGGRIPISSALPLKELVTGEDQYGTDKSRLETLGEIAPYYVLPTGYGQIKKTVQGLSMFDEDHPISGSYTDSGNLRFPVEDTLANRLQAGVFGQWSSDVARDYFNNERNPLKEKQIQELKDLDMPIQDYWDYREGLSKMDELEDKFDYIAALPVSVEQKNIMINNVVDRKEEVDMSNYDDFSSYEEFDFYSKNEEKYTFLQDNGISYEEYTSGKKIKEEYDNIYSWYKNNPDKVTVSKAVTDDVIEYKRITSELSKIRADKNEDGESISGSAKEKKIEYINNLDLDYGQRIILYRMYYDGKEDKANYNQDIVDYLNSRDDLSYDDVVTILEELDFTVYPDGTVEW